MSRTDVVALVIVAFLFTAFFLAVTDGAILTR